MKNQTDFRQNVVVFNAFKSELHCKIGKYVAFFWCRGAPWGAAGCLCVLWNFIILLNALRNLYRIVDKKFPRLELFLFKAKNKFRKRFPQCGTNFTIAKMRAATGLHDLFWKSLVKTNFPKTRFFFFGYFSDTISRSG